MNEKALRTLEYTKIIERLTELAGSSIGKELCRNLKPSSNLAEIEAAQKQTSDALSRIYQRGSISFSGVQDVRGSLKRLEIGGSLSALELLRIAKLLETTSRVKSFGRLENSDREKDSLDDMFDGLQPLANLYNEIYRCILSEDEIADDASPALAKIRRSIRQTNDRVHTQLASLVNGSSRTYLQDAVITMRNGRYCVPVKSEYKGQVPGMIHDQSSTGSTLFIEPMAIVKLNNELRELELQEQKAIEAVLAELSNMAAAENENIADNFRILTQLDFIFARAMLSKSYNGTEPIFNEKGHINIKKGRHPLLDKKSVVPIDIWLGKDFRLLVITGPNTGGKTVSLKTVGLFTLMGQAGLHIPAVEGSELGVFGDVFADIGDEQSIEQSLSTFSSHMTTIVSILKNMDTNSLVLFDELGAGTDPTEGAALATSILDHLHRQGIRAMATTHYSELKVYALSTEGVENACCEFDVESLRPTYRLLIGIPGKSNAFAISSRLGLEDFLIEDAKKRINAQDVSFEDMMAELQDSRVKLLNEQEEITRYKSEIRTLRDALQKKQDRIDERKEKILSDAAAQANAILQEAKDYADETMKNFHKFGKASISVKDMEAERARLREKIKENDSRTAKAAPKPKKKLKAAALHIGDRVRVLSLNLEGTVSTLPNPKGDLFVQMGILRSQVNINDLEYIGEAENLQKGMTTGGGKLRMSKSAAVSTEINLIGMTVDEAIAHLDKYLDDAYLAHVPSVRIVHGKGTGALRTAVHQYLKRCKHVKTFRLGTFGEGDAGVTIAEFK